MEKSKKYHWKSKKWNFYSVLERDLKSYSNMSQNKTRVVLVISNAKSLIDRTVIIECSTKKQNENSIFLQKHINSNGIEKESYVMPDRIHTINSKKLKLKYKIPQSNPTPEQRRKIIEFILSYIEKDAQ